MINCLEGLAPISWGQSCVIWEGGVDTSPGAWPRLKFHVLSLGNEESSWKVEWNKVSLIIKL